MQRNQQPMADSGNARADPHQWVQRYADYLYSYAMARLHNEEQAKDLVQETFLGALERVQQFEGNSSERTWLTAILKNKIVDAYRKRSAGLAKRTEELDAEQEQQLFFNADTGHWNTAYSPRPFDVEGHTRIANKELNQILQRCMQKLPALWLAVFTLKHLDDEATATICSQLKVTQANFWVIIHRAKVNLRACLQKNWA